LSSRSLASGWRYSRKARRTFDALLCSLIRTRHCQWDRVVVMNQLAIGPDLEPWLRGAAIGPIAGAVDVVVKDADDDCGGAKKRARPSPPEAEMERSWAPQLSHRAEPGRTVSPQVGTASQSLRHAQRFVKCPPRSELACRKSPPPLKTHPLRGARPALASKLFMLAR
jgi:hypothetical protein